MARASCPYFSKPATRYPQLDEYEENPTLTIVSRDVPTRDKADRQQPFNLRLAGTTHQTIG